MALIAEYSCQELLQAQLELWHQSLGFFKSAALLIASDLRIADAIHRLGGAATLAQILDEAGIHPCRLGDLRRLMRVLTVSGIFGVQQPPAAASDGRHDHGNPVYKLTAASLLLIRGQSSHLPSIFPCVDSVELMLQPCQGSPVAKGMRAWFQQDQPPPAGLSPFALAFDGQTIWERAEHDAAAFPFDNAMASDTAFLMPIVLKECADVFQGLTSLVDVAGGLGGAAATIVAAFPDLECTVLDLPQVVAKAPSGTSVRYVAGDMFESIPAANAVFLKWILHDWADDECVKILKNCKKAIPPRDAGGKIIIIDIVIGSGPSDIKHLETQVLYDLLIMNINGIERDEQEWKKIFFEAGFKDYKIYQFLASDPLSSSILEKLGEQKPSKSIRKLKRIKGFLYIVKLAYPNFFGTMLNKKYLLLLLFVVYSIPSFP